MKITLVTVGKIKEKFYTDAIAEYAKRLSRYCKLEIIQVADEKTPDKASEAEELQIKDKEGKRILEQIKDGAFVIALAINGNMLDSVELAERIDKLGIKRYLSKEKGIDVRTLNQVRVLKRSIPTKITPSP